MRRISIALATCVLSVLVPLLSGLLMLSCNGKDDEYSHEEPSYAEPQDFRNSWPRSVEGDGLFCWRGLATRSETIEGEDGQPDKCEWTWQVDLTKAGGLQAFDPDTESRSDFPEDAPWDFSTAWVLAVRVSFGFTDEGPPEEATLNHTSSRAHSVMNPAEDMRAAEKYSHVGTYSKARARDLDGLVTRRYPSGEWTLTFDKPSDLSCDEYAENVCLQIVGCMQEKSEVLLRTDFLRTDVCKFTADVALESIVALRPEDSKDDTNRVEAAIDLATADTESLEIDTVTVKFEWTRGEPNRYSLSVPGLDGLTDHAPRFDGDGSYEETFTGPNVIPPYPYADDYPVGSWGLTIVETDPTNNCVGYSNLKLKLRGRMHVLDIP